MALDLGGLNPRQRDAVTAPLAPLLVLAGPGTGKTTVLAWRVAHLVAERRVDPRHLLGVTFTTLAARELRERVTALCPVAAPASLGTLHALGLRVLRRWADRLGYEPRHLSVLDRHDQARVVRCVLDELGLDPAEWPTSVVAEALRIWKREGGWEREPREPFEAILRAVTAAHRRANVVDFDDLITLPLGLLRADPEVLGWARDRHAVLVVDEVQDLDVAQYRLLALLAGPAGAITLVGDPLQTIFAWRGATLRSPEALRADFPALRVVALEETYRSTATILGVASALGGLLREGERVLSTHRGVGEPVRVLPMATDAEEADYVAAELARLRRVGEVSRWGDCAVLYRAGWQAEKVERALHEARIPARRADGHDLLRTREVGDVLAYLRALANPRDTLALARALDRPPRGLGPLVRALRQRRLRSVADLAAHGPALLVRHEARERLAEFLGLLRDLAQDAAPASLAALVTAAIDGSGYARWLESQEDGTRRLRDLELFAELARGSDAADLPAFLDEVAVACRAGDRADPDAVALTTIHRAKGLEFGVVFLVGVAEGILPHAWSRDAPARLAEEVRLAYVAITRARDRLYLTVPALVERDGRSFVRTPSPFLDVLPRHLLAIGPP